MNMFPLAKLPSGRIDWKKSAFYHDDLRVNKMTLESTQLLCTALNVLHGSQITPYKSCHINHPCSKWARYSSMNWADLYYFASHLSFEYTRRFGRTHACQYKLDHLPYLMDKVEFPNFDSSELPLCMPEEFKTDDVVESYRLYWCSKPNMRYVRQKAPNWFTKQRTIPFIGE